MSEKLSAQSFNKHEVPRIEISDRRVLDKEPFVSVMMITYNHEKYIGQAIEGVISQKTTFPIELVIGEDCSPDRTREVALEYQKKYPGIIRIVTSNENVGARQNSSRCDWSCRGKYVAYCEGDDYWHDSSKLQIQVDFLENNPDYGMIYSNADTYCVETGTRVQSAIRNEPEKFTDNPYVDLLTGARHIWPLTVCVRRKLMQAILEECPECTDQSYLMGDTQRFLEVAKRSKIKYLEDSFATRNYLQESATRSQDIHKKARFVDSSKNLILHYLEKYPLSLEQNAKVKRWICLRDIQFAFFTLNKKRADDAFRCLNALKLPIPWKYKLYRWGSSGRLSHATIKTVLDLTLYISSCKRPFLPFLKKS